VICIRLKAVPPAFLHAPATPLFGFLRAKDASLTYRIGISMSRGWFARFGPRFACCGCLLQIPCASHNALVACRAKTRGFCGWTGSSPARCRAGCYAAGARRLLFYRCAGSAGWERYWFGFTTGCLLPLAVPASSVLGVVLVLPHVYLYTRDCAIARLIWYRLGIVDE